MQCFVYASRSRPGTYVYLSARDAFGLLPPALAQRLGRLEFVLALALTPTRRLAQADPAVVCANLAAHGFHVQFPPPAA